ncbi:MAG: DNA repair and recombination protein RadA [Candidatus Micrarchaeaceae archaeon]
MAKEKEIKDIEDLPGVGPTTASKLREAGFDSLDKIAVASPHELAEAVGIGVDVAKKAIDAAKQATQVEYASGLDVFKKRQGMGRISTNSKELDALLGGGVETNAITEAYGRFASGKTQLGFQLCVNVQLAKEQGGLEGGALFIDTEGTFRPERIKELAKAKGLDEEKALGNISIFRVDTSDKQMLVAERAEKIIEEKNIKLIVVDSITALFRSEFAGRGALGERQQKLNAHVHRLQALADKFNLAVYMTNQVMDNPSILFGDPTTPVGGNIIAHAATTRLYLRKSKEDKRIVRLVDSPYLPEGEAVIRITPEGITD